MDNPIRVLHVVRPATGGIRQHVINLLASLAPDVVAQSVAAPPELLADLPADIPTLARLPLDIGKSLAPVHDMRAAYRLAAIVGSNYDLVHAHGLRAAWIVAIARRFANFKNVFTAHNLLVSGAASRGALRMISKTATAIVAVSEPVATTLVQCRVDRELIRVIPNGVDTAYFSHLPADGRQLLDVPPSAFVVGCIARLSAEKGVDVLLQAAALASDVVFLVAGEGPESARLRSMAPSNMRFIGRISDVRVLLSSADVIAIPSRQEGQGIVALEAMVAGVPVVASDVGGLAGMFGGTDAAVLVAPNDPAALTTAIQRLQAHPDLRHSTAESARALVHDRYDLHGMGAATLNLYRAVCGRQV